MPDQPAGASVGSRADSQEVQAGDQAGRKVAPAAPARWLAAGLRLAGSKPVRWGFVAAAVGLGGYAIASDWANVQAGLSKLGFVAVAGAFGCVLVNLLFQMQVYRVLLAALGSPLAPRPAAQILFVGQLGKYLPGSVWPVLAQMELGAAHRVPRTRSASATILTMLLALLTGILVALVMLPFGGNAASEWWVFLFAPVIGVCLYPRVLNRILDWLLRVARRPALERPLTGRAVAVALAWSTGAWVCFGLQIWLLGMRLGLSGGSGLLLAIGAFAFAWCAGFLVVFAPAGAGVREVVLIAVLVAVMSRGDATAVALVSRILLTAGDLVCAGLAAWFARQVRNPAAPPAG
jgi:glycosyltransferase 2 family protein